MEIELTILDWVLFGVLALLALVGLFRGLSGELGSLAGLAVALATGYFLYGIAAEIVSIVGLAGRGFDKPAAVVIDFCFAIVAFGVVRLIVSKFIRFCLGRVTNAFFGLLSGLFKGIVLVGLLTGIGIVNPGQYSEGYLAARSTMVRMIAEWADAYISGAITF